VSKNQQKRGTAKKEGPIVKTPAKPVRNYYVIILIAMTSLVYVSSLSNGWTDWDDEGYVLQDSMIKTFDVPQIFSSYVVGNYHPVTMLVMAAADQLPAGFLVDRFADAKKNDGIYRGIIIRRSSSACRIGVLDQRAERFAVCTVLSACTYFLF
jgi:hypothetical protein